MKRYLAIFLLTVSAFAQNPVITLDESTTYAAYGAGVNIEQSDFYADYLFKNLISINPTLQGQISGVLLTAASGTTTSFTSRLSYATGDNLPANGAVGWTIYVQCHSNGGSNGGDCTGGAQGCTATITSSTAASGSTGPTFNWTTPCASAITADDSVILRSPNVVATCTNATGSAYAWLTCLGWNTSGAVTIDTTPSDLPPVIAGFPAGQCVQFTATPGNPASISQYFDSTDGIQNYAFNGNFHMAIQYSVLAGTNGALGMSITRSGGGGINYSGNSTLVNGAVWSTASQAFTGTESTSAPGTVTYTYTLTSSMGTSSVCLALASLTNDADTNPTAFRDQVITDLNFVHATSLRTNHSSQGETLDNWISPYRQISNASPIGYTPGTSASAATDNAYDLSPEDFLVLAKSTGMKQIDIPIPTFWKTADYVNFADFINGSSGTVYGAKRIALGETAGWANQFDVIHISIGNEAWNSRVFTSYPITNAGWNYIAVAIAACQALKSSASWDSTHMKCGFTGQTAIPYLTSQMIAQDTGHAIDFVDANEYGQYIVGVDGSGANTPANCVAPVLWQSASDEAWANVFDASSVSGFAQTVALGYPVQVYEGANGTNDGFCSQAQMDGYPNGQGYTPTTILTPMLANRYQGITSWNQWQLSQQGFGIKMDGTPVTMPEWGIKTGMGGASNNYRGTAYALQLYNAAANLGTGYSNSISNNPTHSPVARNSVNALTNVPALYAGSFENGQNRSTVVVNADPVNSITFSFAGANVPSGTVTQTLNTASSLTANNEGANISPTNFNTVSTLTNPTNITIPAHSAMRFDWTTTSASTPSFSPGAGTYSSSQNVTISAATPSATIYYTSDGTTPTTSSTVYSGPVTVSSSSTLKAIATASGYTTSAIGSATYTITTGGTPPAAPASLTATAGNAEVSLTWPSVTNATSYNVKRSTTSGGPYTTIASPSLTSYLDTGVVNGTAYFYVVTAANTAGESTPSQQVSATPESSGTSETLLAYEAFADSAGALDGQSGGSGWAAAWTVQSGSTDVPGYNISATTPLSYPGLSTSGNYALGGYQWLLAGRAFDVTASGPFQSYLSNGLIGASGTSIWMSVLLRKDANDEESNAVALHPNGGGVAWYPGNSAVSVGYFGSSSDNNGTRYWSLAIGTTVYRTTVPVVVGQTAILVLEINFNTQTQVSLYVNPTSLGGAAPTSANLQETTNNNLAFQSLAYYAGDDINASSLDEIRLGTSFAAVTPSSGTLLASEAFADSAGALNGLSGGTGWSAAWLVQNGSTDVPGYNISATAPLSYTGLSTSGNYAFGGYQWLLAGRAFDVTASGPFQSYLSNGLIGASGTSIWMSVLLRKDANDGESNSVTLHPNGGGAAWYPGNSGVSVGYFGSSSDNNGIRYWSLEIGTTVYQTTVPVVIGQTAMLVLEINFNTQTQVSLYVNPTSLGGAAPTPANLQETTNSNVAFQSLAYYAGDDINASSLDEIRLGTSFAAVTP